MCVAREEPESPGSCSFKNFLVSTLPESPTSEPASPQKKKAKARDLYTARSLSLEDVTSLFHLRQVEAAQLLGISLTAMKKACRRLGVTRWPYSRQRPRFDIASTSAPQLSSGKIQEASQTIGDDQLHADHNALNPVSEGGDNIDDESSSESCQPDHDSVASRTESWSSAGSVEQETSEQLNDLEDVPLDQSFIQWFVETSNMEDPL
eukprot:768811-Hanusia_phi.AAC.3